jgi:hypothetical protein
MATEAGTDTQDNFFSYNPTGSGIGIGGPNPISLPAGYWPADGIFDPADTTSELYALKGDNPSDPTKYDAILKIADGVTGLNKKVKKCAQGNQDSMNLNNHCSGNVIVGTFSTSTNPGQRSITVKGGSSNNVISGTIQNHQGVDIKLGDWSDQTYDYSTGNSFAQLNAGTAVEGHVKSTTLGSGTKTRWVYSTGLKGFWWLKWAVRKALKIPVNTPGPMIWPFE